MTQTRRLDLKTNSAKGMTREREAFLQHWKQCHPIQPKTQVSRIPANCDTQEKAEDANGFH